MANSASAQGLCKFFQLTGRCKFGERCKFKHNVVVVCEQNQLWNQNRKTRWQEDQQQDQNQPRNRRRRIGKQERPLGNEKFNVGAQRKWVTLSRKPHKSGKNYLFRLVNWNVLAESLLDLDHYPGLPVKYTPWAFREPLILKHVIAELAADILCLQEVDENHFKLRFQPYFRNHHMEGGFKKRTGEKLDGCAIFFNTKKFALVKIIPIEYHAENDELLDRDNIALCMVLKHLEQNKEIIVCTTHLLFNPRRGDIKLAQLQVLFSALRECKVAFPQASIVLCGDFNSTPNSAVYHLMTEGELSNMSKMDRRRVSGQDAIIKHPRNYPRTVLRDGPHGGSLTFGGKYRPIIEIDEQEQEQGQEEEDQQGLKQIDDVLNEYVRSEHQGEEQEVETDIVDRGDEINVKRKRFDPHYFSLPMRLDMIETGLGPFQSAYALPVQDQAKCTGEPAFTTFHYHFKGCVDYIFYQSATDNQLFPTRILGTPQNYGRGIPSVFWPSDHISLAVDFCINE